MAPLDAVALTAVSGVAVPLFQSLIDSGGKILGLFGRQIDRATKQTIYTASGEYANRYTQRHGRIKLLGMRQPLDLGAVAVPLQVSVENEARRFASAAESERAFARTGRFTPPPGVVFPALELARQKRCVMVLGTPGSGKTTVLRQVGLEALRGGAGAKPDEDTTPWTLDAGEPTGNKGREKSSETTGAEGSNDSSGAIPVFVELKRFAAREFDLHEELVNEFEVCGFPEADGFVDIALDRGKLLILLDGLDELPVGDRNGAIGQIQDFVDRHNKNRFLCSCRSSVYQHNLKQFVDAVVLSLTPSQVQQFAQRWSIARPIETAPEAAPEAAPKTRESSETAPDDGGDPENRENSKAVDIAATEGALNGDAIAPDDAAIGAVDKPDTATALANDPELADLSRSPLLLTLLNSIEPASLHRLSARPFLYREIVALYLRTWREFKRVTRPPIHPDFGLTLQQRFLGEVALEASKAKRVFLARRDLVTALADFLRANLQADDRLDGDAILDAIVSQSGILTERARDVFSFDRVTLQADGAARALADRALTDREIDAIAYQYLGDPLWRSIFPLWLARLGDRGALGDVLLQALEKAAKKRPDPIAASWLHEADETLTVEAVTLRALRPWQAALGPFSIAAIATELVQVAPPPTPSPANSTSEPPNRFQRSFQQLWDVLQTDVLASRGEVGAEVGNVGEPSDRQWRSLAVQLVTLETIARCRAIVADAT